MDHGSETSKATDYSILHFWSHSLSRFGNDTNLSPRELEIMGVMIREITQSEDIALELSISTHTVNNHLKNIFEKTKTRSKTDVLAKFFSYATKNLVSNYLPSPLSRPYRIQILSQDLSYSQKLGAVLTQKGAHVHATSLFKQENYLPGNQFDLVIKPLNFSKEMDVDELLPIRKSHQLCIQLEKNSISQESENLPDLLAKPDFLCLGCIGSISQTDSLDISVEKIAALLMTFCPTRGREFPDAQSKKIDLGTIQLPIESLGTHGLFLGMDEMGKSKFQWQTGNIVEFRLQLPHQSSGSIEIMGIVVWKRLTQDMGKKPGLGIWFLNFPRSDGYFSYQAFIQNFQINWALPAATDQFESMESRTKAVQLPAGA